MNSSIEFRKIYHESFAPEVLTYIAVDGDPRSLTWAGSSDSNELHGKDLQKLLLAVLVVFINEIADVAFTDSMKLLVEVLWEGVLAYRLHSNALFNLYVHSVKLEESLDLAAIASIR